MSVRIFLKMKEIGSGFLVNKKMFYRVLKLRTNREKRENIVDSYQKVQMFFV